MTTKQIVILAYAGWLVLLSIIAFIAYGVDKKKAKSGKWRTKEKTLLLLSFLGGAFGGYPAINWLGLIIHTTLMILIIFVFKF